MLFDITIMYDDRKIYRANGKFTDNVMTLQNNVAKDRFL